MKNQFTLLSSIFFIILSFVSSGQSANSTHYCSMEMMDCSAFGMGDRMLACKDCSRSYDGSCAEDPSTCMEGTPQICSGPCRRLAAGARLIYGEGSGDSSVIPDSSNSNSNTVQDNRPRSFFKRLLNSRARNPIG